MRGQNGTESSRFSTTDGGMVLQPSYEQYNASRGELKKGIPLKKHGGLEERSRTSC